jgi:hypothetical protein
VLSPAARSASDRATDITDTPGARYVVDEVGRVWAREVPGEGVTGFDTSAGVVAVLPCDEFVFAYTLAHVCVCVRAHVCPVCGAE